MDDLLNLLEYLRGDFKNDTPAYALQGSHQKHSDTKKVSKLMRNDIIGRLICSYF